MRKEFHPSSLKLIQHSTIKLQLVPYIKNYPQHTHLILYSMSPLLDTDSCPVHNHAIYPLNNKRSFPFCHSLLPLAHR